LRQEFGLGSGNLEVVIQVGGEKISFSSSLLIRNISPATKLLIRFCVWPRYLLETGVAGKRAREKRGNQAFGPVNTTPNTRHALAALKSLASTSQNSASPFANVNCNVNESRLEIWLEIWLWAAGTGLIGVEDLRVSRLGWREDWGFSGCVTLWGSRSEK